MWVEGFSFSCRVSLEEQYRQTAKSRATNKPVCFVHVSVLTPFPLLKFVISWVFFLPAFLSHVLLESIWHMLIKQSTASRFSWGKSSWLFEIPFPCFYPLSPDPLHSAWIEEICHHWWGWPCKNQIKWTQKSPKPFTVQALMSLQVLKDLLCCNSQTCKLIMETPDQCNVNSERFLP